MNAPTGRRLVSVCVPSYNDGTFLPETLASIAAQTYSEVEIIVCDDASTDETAQVVEAAADPRIRYECNSTRLGLFPNMNRCIELARGEFVAIYHSDDVYEPTIVEEEVAFLEQHPEAGAVFTLDSWIDQYGHQYGETTLPQELPDRPCLTMRDLLPVLLRYKNCILRCPSFMARSSVLAEVGDFASSGLGVAADLDYYMRLLERHPIGIIRKPLLRYRHDRSQESSMYDHLRTVEEHFFTVIDTTLALDSVVVDERSLTEYDFHLADDRVTRAANHLILGDTDAARELVRAPFPWKTFSNGITRRKVRVVLMRTALRCALALRATRPVGRLLLRTEYHSWTLR